VHAVILPGLDGDARLRADFASALAPDFEARAVDFPPDLAGDYARFLAVCEAALPRQGEFILVAESFSGPIALQLAATRPTGLRGLVLCASFARHPLAMLAPVVRLAPGLSPSLVPDSVLDRFLLGRWSTPALVAQLRASTDRLSPVAIRTRLLAAANVDCTPLLESLGTPLLFLRATSDRVVPASAADVVLRHCPSAIVSGIDAPHAILSAAPRECVRRIVDWFRTL